MATIDYRKSDAFKKKLPRLFQYLVLVIVTLIIVVPLVIMVFGALKDAARCSCTLTPSRFPRIGKTLPRF